MSGLDVRVRPLVALLGLLLVAAGAGFAQTAETQIAETQSSEVASAVAAEQLAPAEAEEFRAQLLTMMKELGQAPGMEPTRVDAAIERVRSAGDAELSLLHRNFARLPNWQQLPAIVLSFSETSKTPRAAATRSASLGSLVGPQSPEEFRSDFLLFLGRLESIALLSGDEDLLRRIADVQQGVRDFPSQELHQLQAMFQRAGPGWKSQLIMGSSPVSDKILFGSCDGNCSWADIPCWVSELECDTSKIVSEIASLGTAIQDVVNDIGDFFTDVVNTTGSLLTDVGDFFTGLWDTVKSGFEWLLSQLLDQIPSSPQEALALIGLDLSAGEWAAWWNNFNNAAVTLNSECTALGLGIGADIPGFGEVGSPRAEFVCKRGLMWVDEKVSDVLGQVIGDDGDGDDDLRTPGPSPAEFSLTTPAQLQSREGGQLESKIGVGLVYTLAVSAPIKFFCNCLVHGSALSFDAAQLEHRNTMASLLDADFESRLKEANLVATSNDAALITPAVAAVQADVVAAEAARSDLQLGVGGVRGVLGTDGLDDQADQLKDLLDRQGDGIRDFKELELRLDIEEALRDGSAAPTGGFQLPAALGGHLELTADIVLQTIEQTETAGLNVFDARAKLQQGDSLFLEGAWEKAWASYQRAYLAAVGEIP